jgi:uncharacterized repeat protein (TIGR01451 family)
MKTRTINRRPFLSVLAVAASLFLALLITAPRVEANAAYGATILNTVQIDYTDAGGLTVYHANATTSVTVNLVKTGLIISGRPTVGSPGSTAGQPGGATVDSGSTASYIIALTAKANGGDTYNLTPALNDPSNITGAAFAWATVGTNGSTVITAGNPATVSLGASIIQANTSNTISIPGGSLADSLIQAYASGSSAGNRVLVVNGVDYRVSSISGSGNAPSNTHNLNQYYNDLGTATPEQLVVITLVANPDGAAAAPSFTVNALKGTIAGEQILVNVIVSASVGPTMNTNGTVDFNVTTSSSGGGNVVTLPTGDITTTFRSNNLQVRKTVANCGTTGTCGSYAASATGNPGDILEYKVEVNNAGGSVAKLVKAADAVPTYTQLVCGAAISGASALGTAACTGTPTTAAIATIQKTGSASATYISFQSSDNECGSGDGSGNAAGFAETNALNFYLGSGCTASAGGDVDSAATYTIIYRVKMN